MPGDAIGVLPSGDPSARPVATDVIDGQDHQLLKNEWGKDGTAHQVEDDDASRFPVGGGLLVQIAEVVEALGDLLGEEGADLFFGRLLDVLQLNGVVLAPGASVVGAVKRAEAPIYVSLPVGAGTTDPIDIRGYTVTGILVPATFSGTVLNYLVSPDGLNYLSLFDATNVVVAQTVAAGRAYPLWGELNGWSFMKIASNATQVTKPADFILQAKS